uniref:Uncharacterized protein n=1 Tax=Trichogramma kaykai TaxID=54128 RepID=A0ABD2WMQ2_9HYME
MSIDVFGRVLGSKQEQPARGISGIGYKFTVDGVDFDIEGKRLCNVGAPADTLDAINFETLHFNINGLSGANDKVREKFEEKIAELERRIDRLEADEPKKRSRRRAAQTGETQLPTEEGGRAWIG